LSDLDLEEIGNALADRTDYEHQCLINPRTGETRPPTTLHFSRESITTVSLRGWDVAFGLSTVPRAGGGAAFATAFGLGLGILGSLRRKNYRAPQTTWADSHQCQVRPGRPSREWNVHDVFLTVAAVGGGRDSLVGEGPAGGRLLGLGAPGGRGGFRP
jgi:hypothetical protein